MTTTQAAGTGERTVVGNISLSLDGRVSGPGGDHDMGWVARHAVSDAVRDHAEGMYRAATTVLLGRKNYEGFKGFWPPVADDEAADPRDRWLAAWLNKVEKVVFSTTVREPEWENTRIVDAEPAEVVKDLKRSRGGGIVVLNSGSVIRNLLAAGVLDRLSIVLCPELSGGGARLFADEFPASSWQLSASTTSDTGALCLFYDRIRAAG
jgi:dihydrofolate reductase